MHRLLLQRGLGEGSEQGGVMLGTMGKMLNPLGLSCLIYRQVDEHHLEEHCQSACDSTL